MGEHHKNGYHLLYPDLAKHQAMFTVPALPGDSSDAGTDTIRVFVSKLDTPGVTVGSTSRYAGAWAYALTWGDTELLHGDVLKSFEPKTHEQMARIVAESASYVAESSPQLGEVLAERLAMYADGELPQDGDWSWTLDSACWQVEHGDQKDRRFASALRHLRDHYRFEHCNGLHGSY